MMESIRLMAAGSLLAVCAYTDAKRKRISLLLLGVYFAAGLCLLTVEGFSDADDLLAGMTVGVLIYLLHKVTGGGIGLGDALLFIVTGIYLGFARNMQIFLLALLFGALCSIILLMTGKVRRGYELPFVPFALLAYFWVVAI